MLTLATQLQRHARYRPDAELVVVEECRLTAREFDERVGRVAGMLAALGLTKGDALAVLLPNGLELLELYWAGARLGLVVVPLSTLLRAPALEPLLRDAGVRAVVSCAAMLDTLDALRAAPTAVAHWLLVDAAGADGYGDYAALSARAAPAPQAALAPGDPYNIVYSSGTTGQPKGIVHTHEIRALYGTLFTSVFRMRPESVVLHAGSLVFNGAFVTLMPAFLLGARYVLQRKFDARAFVEAIARERVTHVMMVPSQIVAMLDAPGCTREALASLEMLCSVGAPLHREHKSRLREVAPDALYELYGLTEGFVTILDRTDYARKMGSVGVPTLLHEMRIVSEDGRDLPPGEVGEIVGRGPLLMPGYHARPDLTALAIRDGWLHTGDLGYVDDDGFLYLVDRKKDMIISGGVNVYPRDIEEVLVAHAAVREAAVFGAPHEKWGEVPVAAVVLREGAAVTAEELRAWTNARVGARYQQLAEVALHAELPRNSAGKTLKRELREPYWAGRDVRI